MLPQYDLDKIRFGVDKGTFDRAVKIYESGGITDFLNEGRFFYAKVKGSKNSFYDVEVSDKSYDRGDCDCYLGQNNILCKHMIAVALYPILQGEKIDMNEVVEKEPACSGKLGELDKEELAKVKKEISLAMKLIKAYSGPSKTWFAYTNSLCEGSRRLDSIFSKLPASKQTSDLVIKILLRLDKKLCQGGVDDSDGAVGGLIYGTVEILKEFARLDKKCLKSFEIFMKQKTCFGWEKDLVDLLDKNNQ